MSPLDRRINEFVEFYIQQKRLADTKDVKESLVKWIKEALDDWLEIY